MQFQHAPAILHFVETSTLRCQVTPLLSLFGHGRSGGCYGETEKLKETIKVLVDRGANMSVPVPLPQSYRSSIQAISLCSVHFSAKLHLFLPWYR